MNNIIFSTLIFFICSASDLVDACTPDKPSMEDLYSKNGVEIVGPLLISEIESDINKRRKELGLKPINESQTLKDFKKSVKFGDKIYFFKESGRGYYMDGYILERNGCAVEFLPGAVS